MSSKRGVQIMRVRTEYHNTCNILHKQRMYSKALYEVHVHIQKTLRVKERTENVGGT